MSRPILSRPRTRVYGCNYDKGESYYKPMVDHLDRKYSARPLFSEPRNSLADEIAARRGDIGVQNLYRNDYFDDLDYLYDRGMENDLEDDFVITQRRHKERAAAAFAEDLADLRRKRRDMQDRFFDVINLDAEIEKARNTLEQADFAFQRHATKFDNTEENCDDLSSKKFIHLEGLSPKPVPKTIKLVKVPNIDMTSYLPQPAKSKRVRAKIDDNADSKIEDPLNVVAMLPLKRRFSNRKKNVSF